MSVLSKPSHGFGFALELANDETLVAPPFAPSTRPHKLNRTAIGSGLAAVLICTALLAPQISAVLAENTDGSTNFFLQERKSRPVAVRAAFEAPANLGSANFSFPVHGATTAGAGVRNHGVTSNSPGGTFGTGGKQSVCVRLCDGYFFPVGDFAGAGETSAQEAVCDNLCPGAPTRLYVLPSGSDKIEDAVSARDGKLYTALPAAFRHTTSTERTCACHSELRPSSVRLLQDYTLRKGDGVMTPKGIRVFHGAQHWPYNIEQVAKGQRPVGPKVKASVPVRVSAPPLRTTRDVTTGRSIRVVGPQAMLEE